MRRGWRKALLVAGLLTVVLLSNAWLVTTEAGAVLLTHLLHWQSSWPDMERVRTQAQAIAVLGGGEGREDVGVKVHLATGVPLLLVGRGEGNIESETMEADVLRRYGIGPRWVENESRDTRENARFSWCLVSGMGVRRVALVTHAFHMPRARRQFEAAGFEVIPLPMPDDGKPLPPLTWRSFLPSRSGIQAARRPAREWVGILFRPFEVIVDPPRRCPYKGTPQVH